MVGTILTETTNQDGIQVWYPMKSRQLYLIIRPGKFFRMTKVKILKDRIVNSCNNLFFLIKKNPEIHILFLIFTFKTMFRLNHNFEFNNFVSYTLPSIFVMEPFNRACILWIRGRKTHVRVPWELILADGRSSLAFVYLTVWYGICLKKFFV